MPDEFKDFPFFAYNKNVSSDLEYNLLLFPDSFMLNNFEDIILAINNGIKEFSYYSKKSKIFWRGGTAANLGGV